MELDVTRKLLEKIMTEKGGLEERVRKLQNNMGDMENEGTADHPLWVVHWTLEEKTTGITLEVTPYVSGNSSIITLDIHPVLFIVVKITLVYLGAIILMRYWEKAFAVEYQILTSRDAKKWQELVTMRDQDGEEDEIEFSPIKARYVKFIGLKRIRLK